MGRFSPAHPDCITNRKAGVKLDMLIIHAMDGTLRGSEAWFKQGRDKRPVPTAAHYLVGRDGEIVQMVPDNKKAIHAGNYNSRSIGIELEARLNPWASRGKLPPFPTGEYPDAMLDAAARVVAALCKTHGIPCDRAHIVGHSEVPGATHTDPGAAFPWPDFMARCAAVA